MESDTLFPAELKRIWNPLDSTFAESGTNFDEMLEYPGEVGPVWTPRHCDLVSARGQGHHVGMHVPSQPYFVSTLFFSHFTPVSQGITRAEHLDNFAASCNAFTSGKC